MSPGNSSLLLEIKMLQSKDLSKRAPERYKDNQKRLRSRLRLLISKKNNLRGNLSFPTSLTRETISTQMKTAIHQENQFLVIPAQESPDLPHNQLIQRQSSKTRSQRLRRLPQLENHSLHNRGNRLPTTGLEEHHLPTVKDFQVSLDPQTRKIKSLQSENQMASLPLEEFPFTTGNEHTHSYE